MGWTFLEDEHDHLGGFNSQDNPADIEQTRKLTRMATAQNVFAPGDRDDLQTAPGFDPVRSTPINAAGIVTGMRHLSEIADKFLLTVSIAGTSHNIYDDVANPPTAITGGTNFTIGANNLVSIVLGTDGTNSGAILMSLLRDTPQFVTGAAVRSNFVISGTTLPAFGTILGGRLLMGAPSVGGTVFDDRVYWSDIRNHDAITDTATQFESFETYLKDKVRGLLVFSDVCLVGKRHEIFLLPPTPSGTSAFGTPQRIALGMDRGPVGHQAMIEVNDQAFWLGFNGIYSMNLHEGVKRWADHLRPTFTAILDNATSAAALEFAVAGHDAKHHLILWAVPAAGSATRNRVLALNYLTGELYLWTRTRHAYATRLVSGDPRLVGGGRVGLFYNENTSATTGDADDATAAIDADIITPRHHCGSPHIRKLFGGVKVTFDPQATSEAVTLSYRLDDASSWSDFAASPYTVTGTANDLDTKYLPLMKVGTHLQLRFRDANSGHVYRLQKYAILWRLVSPMVN